jgi:hypothetical protein
MMDACPSTHELPALARHGRGRPAHQISREETTLFFAKIIGMCLLHLLPFDFVSMASHALFDCVHSTDHHHL